MTTSSMAQLRVDSVTLTFGAVQALTDVSLCVEPGAIHAVIGPNGAGKSSLFNVLTGVYRPTSGEVSYGGAITSGLRPHQVAGLGIARTFQNIELAHGTTEKNILLGRHHLMRHGVLRSGLGLPSARREERLHAGRVREIAEFLGISEALSSPAGDLPYGDQKRVELARALAIEPELLLLDEPVAGMNATEKQEMTETLRELHSALGITLVLVEHDMSMVMSLATHCTVLDFGRVISDGTPSEIQRDSDVIRAYLGAPDDAAPTSAPDRTRT